MPRLDLNFSIYEKDDKWCIDTCVPNMNGTVMHLTAKDRDSVLDSFANTMKDNNIRYWYLMLDD